MEPPPSVHEQRVVRINVRASSSSMTGMPSRTGYASRSARHTSSRLLAVPHQRPLAERACEDVEQFVIQGSLPPAGSPVRSSIDASNMRVRHGARRPLEVDPPPAGLRRADDILRHPSPSSVPAVGRTGQRVRVGRPHGQAWLLAELRARRAEHGEKCGRLTDSGDGAHAAGRQMTSSGTPLARHQIDASPGSKPRDQTMVVRTAC